MNTITVRTKCPSCGDVQWIECDMSGFYAWKYDGWEIQRALPSLTASQREALQTGFCDPCWEQMKPKEAHA